MDYTFTPDAPKPIDPKRYGRLIQKEYEDLLLKEGKNEAAFQKFFEQNPSLLPGSRGVEPNMFGSGHPPLKRCVITQPKISGVITRHPDFMWLVNDSSVFSPVLIEIEAPDKKLFNKDGSPTQDFTKAKHQLTEWRTVLSNPTNILSFYNQYNIPQEYRDLYFEPWFVLIYGRRREFEDDKNLTSKRPLMTDRAGREILMSFDSLKHVSKADSEAITCTVKDGKYIAKYVSPLLTIGPYCDSLDEIQFPNSSIIDMVHTTEERKNFLLKKIPYCQQYIKENEYIGFTFSLDDLDRQIEE